MRATVGEIPLIRLNKNKGKCGSLRKVRILSFIQMTSLVTGSAPRDCSQPRWEVKGEAVELTRSPIRLRYAVPSRSQNPKAIFATKLPQSYSLAISRRVLAASGQAAAGSNARAKAFDHSSR